MRLLFVLLCVVIHLCALDITSKETPVYKEIAFIYDIDNIQEVINSQDGFIKSKHFIRTFQKQSHDQLWLKIPLVNPTNKDLERVFVSRWERVNFEFYVVKDNKVLASEILLNDNYIKRSLSVTIPAKQSIDFYIHIKKQKPIDQFFYMKFVESSEVDNYIITNEKLYHHGLLFGILLTMAMYSFFIYFSIKEKGYLLLGLYQTSVLIASSDLREYFFLFLEEVPDFADFLLRGVFGYIIMFLAILFTKEFLNTKKEMPRFDLFLNILMIFILPLNAIDSKVNYAGFLFIIFVFAGLYVYFRTKNLQALLYALGFLGFPLYLILSNLVIWYDWDFYFDFDYAKQIFTCVESFMLTVALSLKIRQIVKEKEKAKEEINKNEKLILEQSRFASMGEMLASIAHQWRQPLNHLNMMIGNLQLAFEHNKLDKAYMEKKSDEIDNQLKYMSSTIENFSTFFATKEKKESFYLVSVCEYTIELVQSRLKKHNIYISLISYEDKLHENYKNELIQVLTIIVNNAIDALVINKIEKPHIEMIVQGTRIIVKDNAKGIDAEVLPKIFDPYFTTKDKSFGTGLGLYTSKIIMNSLINGEIEVKNSEEGACFTIRL